MRRFAERLVRFVPVPPNADRMPRSAALASNAARTRGGKFDFS